MGQPTGRQDRILAPGAQQKYASLMYNPTTTPQQKSDLTTQYNDAVQADKALDQIDKLFPQLANKSTWGGALSEHIDPNAFGAAGAAAAEGLGAAGAIPTAGASLVGAVPGAILAGGAGKLIGEGLKTGARVVGGQQEEQYRTGVEALKTIVANALAGAKVTPTEAGGIVDQFIPTKFNSEETVKDKLEKLKQKIISITRTSALDNARMTNR
jgi:hypothetical protein